MVSVLQSLDTRMRLLLLLGLLFFTYAAEQGENSFTFYNVLMYIVGAMLEMCSSSCQSRVLSAVKMGLTPPRTASVTLCAHTTRAVAQTMSPFVVLGVSLPYFINM